MPRYEFSEGTSNKFWEITLSGTSFTTTYGRIGTAGQSTTKSFGSAAEAQKEYDKLVAEKVKKGYQLAGEGAAAPAASGGSKKDARNPELEKAILEDPENQQVYSVFADWLQEQGDPRGELMSLQIAGKEKEAKAFLQKNEPYFLGKLAEHQQCYDGDLGNNARSNSDAWVEENKQAFLWKNGFIHRVRLAHDSYADEEFEGKLVDILKMVLAHPSGRYIVEFAFNSNGDPNEDNLDDLLELLGKKAPPTTRKIIIGDNVDQISWYHAGDLGKLWKGVPNLRTFEIEAGEFDVGKMDVPGLQTAIFKTGGLSLDSGAAIAKAKIPNIRHLEVWYGDENYGGNCTIEQVLPLLNRTDLPHLRHLGLKNSEFANDIARAVASSKLVAQLTHLDLSMGTMTDEGAEALLANAKKFEHLEVLDLTRNFLSDDMVERVAKLAKKVITDDQEEGDEYDGETHYYVALGE